jgi:glycosyltransferase involved in cell wall biosynthesis
MLYTRAARTATHEGVPINTTLVRVAAVPAAHPYVRAITDPQHVELLPDPVHPGAPAGQWWPPRVLSPSWLDEHAPEFDVLHIHFGLESFTPDQLTRALDRARRHGRPVVYTVHDLENPQLTDQAAYLRLLDVIVPSADEVITLTPTAAAEVRRRWNRTCTVIAHPSLLETPPAPKTRSTPHAPDTLRIGVHLRDLRPNIDAERAVTVLAGAVTALGQRGITAEVEVRLNTRVRDEDLADRLTRAANPAAGTTGRVRIHRGERLSDDELAGWLTTLDAFVLPYRHGTHSGWVELCYDLAVPVIGTRVGHVRSQHPADFFAFDLDDASSLVDALDEVASRTHTGTDRDAEVARRRARRQAQRDDVRAQHVDVYLRALANQALGERAGA